MRTHRSLLFLLVFLAGSPLYADCGGGIVCRASGHHITRNGDFPYSESSTPANQPAPVTLNGPTFNWTLLVGGCAQLGGNNIVADTAFHTKLLLYLHIQQATAAPGAQYEVQLRIDGVEKGWFVRSYRGILPQGDHFGTIAKNIPPGQHKYEVYGRLLSPGSLTFHQQFSTSIGSPTTFPYESRVESPQITLNANFTNVTAPITFTTPVAVNLYFLGYFQWDAGTPNDEVRVQFLVDGVEPPGARASEVAVPPFFRDGVNIYDHRVNVPAGTHTITMRAKTLHATRTAKISNRAAQFASYPYGTPPNGGAIGEQMNTGLLTVDPSNPGTSQPAIGGGCGYWTKLHDFNLAPTSGNWNWTGEGYVRLMGNKTGDWTTSSRAEILVEATTGGAISDMHWMPLGPPNGRGELFYFIDSMLWGNGQGQHVTVWIRKVKGCGHGNQATFDIGRRYVSVSLVPATGVECYYD